MSEEEKKELRDMVAAWAMVGMAAGGACHEHPDARIAADAFDLADAWMKEREARHAR